MWKIIARIKRKPGLTHQQFRDYYETKHVPLAAPYLRGLAVSYTRNYVGQAARYAPESADWMDGEEAAAPAYDCITIIAFEEKAHLDEIVALLSRQDVVDVIIPDEERFIDRPATEFAICEESSLGTTPEELRKAA